MGWFLTLVVLAVLAWFLFRHLSARGANAPGGTPDPLDHDRDGLNRPLPGQRAGTEGEVRDAARSHVGGHLEGANAEADGGVSPGMAARVAAAGTVAAGAVGAAAGARGGRDGGVAPEAGATLPSEASDGEARGAPLEGSERSGTNVGGADDMPDGDTAARVREAARDEEVTAGHASAGHDPDDGEADMHRVGASVRTQPDLGSQTDSRADSRTDGQIDSQADSQADSRADTGTTATRADGGSRAAANDGIATDAAAAARAAHDSAQSGGTGAAVLAGIATAAGAGHGHDDGHDDGHDEDSDAARTNPPDPDTAGNLDPTPRRSATEAARDGDGAPVPGGRADDTGATTRVPDGGDATQSMRDNAATNAPLADAAPGEAAREPADVPAADVAARAPDGAPPAPAERVNAPDPASAGGLDRRERAVTARSTLVAGTASLAVGGATALGGKAVREGDGATGGSGGGSGGGNGAAGGAVADGSADRSRLADGDARGGVREMMKILNLREADASRLDISKEDFARLWRGERDVSDSLVDEVTTRLRRMLGG